MSGNGLCQFKNVLGEPGKGVHRFRVFNVAVFDVVGTFALAWLLFRFAPREWGFAGPSGPSGYLKAVVVMFVVAEALHLLFCVDTTVAKWIRSLL